MSMRNIRLYIIILVALGANLICCTPSPQQENKSSLDDSNSDNIDPLPSWNEGNTRQAIIDFVIKTTTKGSADFIPDGDRIATFDNDGTLWAEQPMYFQLFFAIDRIKAMAPEHPEWKDKQPFKALLEGDVKTALSGGEHAIIEIVMTTHSGMTVEEFNKTVKDWMANAIHPQTGKHFNEMIYQPMVELLDYLRSNGYKLFIVSGGGIDFMRAWVEESYGIPPYQVLGSSGKVKYEIGSDQVPRLVKLPEMNFIDDKEGKPIGIHQYIGKRPVFAAGNSDGDYPMLHWTSTAGGYPRLCMLLHHTDSEREWAYDRNSHIGRLDKGLIDAENNGWIVADMKKDWKVIYPFELKED